MPASCPNCGCCGTPHDGPAGWEGRGGGAARYSPGTPGGNGWPPIGWRLGLRTALTSGKAAWLRLLNSLVDGLRNCDGGKAAPRLGCRLADAAVGLDI